MSQVIIAAGVLNVLVGAAFTITVYLMLERVPTLAGVLGFLLATGVVFAEKNLGEALLSATRAEMKLLAMAAVIGAVFGIASITTIFEPTTK